MLTTSGKQVTADFIRVRVVYVAVCLASLVLWYWITLRTLTWPQGTLLVLSLLSLSCSEAFLAPRLKNRAGLTLLLTVAELAYLVWLVWFLTPLGG